MEAETVSEMLDFNSILTRLIARDDLIDEIFTSYKKLCLYYLVVGGFLEGK
jgi:hypothetical protein